MSPIAHSTTNLSDFVTNATSFRRKPESRRESDRLDTGFLRYYGWRFRNKNRSILGTVFCLLAVALLSACASPSSHFYTLTQTRAVPPGAAFSASIAVGPVSVPESVNRPEIVVQVGPNEVALDEFNRWAAPLPSEIQRVVVENLVQLLGTQRVSRYPQGSMTSPDFRVQIEVLRFESAPGDAALLEVLWTVHGKNDKEVKTGRTMVREPVSGQSYDALAAAHSRALGTLSRDLAEAIVMLE